MLVILGDPAQRTFSPASSETQSKASSAMKTFSGVRDNRFYPETITGMNRERRLENLQVTATALEGGSFSNLKEPRSFLKEDARQRDRRYDIGDFLQSLTDLHTSDALEIERVGREWVPSYQKLEMSEIELTEGNYFSADRRIYLGRSIDMGPFREHFGAEDPELVLELERTGSGLRIEYLVSNFPEAEEARVGMAVYAPEHGVNDLEDVYSDFLEGYVDKIWGDRIETLLDREEESGNSTVTA